ncbi:hypothetical protein IWW36_001804 [Coemansia brasiliensis]|uniref:Uncharacterized protein n=1 Tax=Coemansia brasiliensis TaxID=2650707 RepID=A0A9W8M178_9FUNG|nr:hypothetical protein IWW36_001804 [Coemansia brasiliensis]
MSLNQTTEYEVYITSGTNGLFPKAYKLELDDIHVHPYYNQTSLEYNIAVVEFNKNTTSTYEAYIYKGMFEVANSVFVRQSYDHDIVDYTGKTQIGGDIFAARNEFYGPLIDPTSEVRSMPQETSSDFESLSESSIDSSLDDSLDNSPDSSGLERSQILAIAITIPLSIVCITAAIGLFYYRRLKSKRTRNRDDDDDWDPYAERLNIRELANEIRGIGDPIQPPSYNEVMRPPSTPSPGPSTENQATQSSSKEKSTKEA